MTAVPAELTAPLRRRVLRPGAAALPGDALPGDEQPGTVQLAVLDPAGRVLAAGNIRPERPPWALPAEVAGWRVRGMATEPGRRGHGHGRAILAGLLAHAADQGGGLVWCNARLPALRFYARAGFSGRGRAWEDPEIGGHLALSRWCPGAGLPAGRRAAAH